jgi:protein-ribulosamine 3-kinase
MVSSEYKSMRLLYELVPDMVAEPIAWGAYKEEADTYFFVCRFCELSGDIPDTSDFPRLLADMHQRAVSKSGEFGLPLVTYSGRNAQYFPPSKSWEECFSKGLTAIFNKEEEMHGPNEELRMLREAIMNKVIPRLLRPLESDGRTLTPRLVHGDLWDGNASTDLATGKPMIFDAVPLYAHNECECPPASTITTMLEELGTNTQLRADELAPWWAPRHKMTDKYITEYVRHFPEAEPVEDFRDRGLLYRL